MDRIIITSIRLIATGIFLGIGLGIGSSIGKELVKISIPRFNRLRSKKREE